MKNAVLELIIIKLNKYKKSLKQKIDNQTNIVDVDKQFLFTFIDKINIFFNNLYLKDYVDLEDLNRLLDNLITNIKTITVIEKEKTNCGYLSFKKRTLYLNRNCNIDTLIIFYYKNLIKACRTNKKIEGFSSQILKEKNNYGADILNETTAQDIAEEFYYMEKGFPRLEIPSIPTKTDNFLEQDFYFRSNLKENSFFQPLAIEFLNCLMKKRYRYNAYKKIMRDLNKLSFQENIGEIIYERFAKTGLEKEYLKIMDTFDYLIKYKKENTTNDFREKKIATNKIKEITNLINKIEFSK